MRVLESLGSRLLSISFPVAITLILIIPSLLAAQTPAVPRLIRFSGSLPISATTNTPSVTNITFSLYIEELGGSPLWSEHQNVTVTADGHYDVLLGASSAEGLPLELFTNSQARWLGVRTEDGQELPRQLLCRSVDILFPLSFFRDNQSSPATPLRYSPG